MKETIETIIQWHRETFPDATLEGQLEKFEDERVEYGESESLEELADLFIVACGIARFDYVVALRAFWFVEKVLDIWTEASVSRYALQEAVEQKMQINRKREWVIGKGNYQHKE